MLEYKQLQTRMYVSVHLHDDGPRELVHCRMLATYALSYAVARMTKPIENNDQD